MTKKAIFFPPNFPKELLTPLPRPKRAGINSQPDNADRDKELARRLDLLLAYYGLTEPNGYRYLGLHLIFDLIPGFRGPSRNPAGRRAKDPAEAEKRRARLLVKMENIQLNRADLSERSAYAQLARRKGEFFGQNVETLKKDLQMAKAERHIREMLSTLLKCSAGEANQIWEELALARGSESSVISKMVPTLRGD